MLFRSDCLHEPITSDSLNGRSYVQLSLSHSGEGCGEKEELWIELLSGGTRRAKAKDYCTCKSRTNTVMANKKEVVPCTRSYHGTMHT